MSEHDLRLHGLEERHERAKHAEIEARSANVEVGECDDVNLARLALDNRKFAKIVSSLEYLKYGT